MLHQTALHATHEALGATLVDFGGWDMPLWYPTGAVKEHLAVIRHAGLFDIGHMAGIMVSGPDALEALQWAFTKDLSLSGARQLQHLPVRIVPEAGPVIFILHLLLF